MPGRASSPCPCAACSALVTHVDLVGRNAPVRHISTGVSPEFGQTTELRASCAAGADRPAPGVNAGAVIFTTTSDLMHALSVDLGLTRGQRPVSKLAKIASTVAPNACLHVSVLVRRKCRTSPCNRDAHRDRAPQQVQRSQALPVFLMWSQPPQVLLTYAGSRSGALGAADHGDPIFVRPIHLPRRRTVPAISTSLAGRPRCRPLQARTVAGSPRHPLRHSVRTAAATDSPRTPAPSSTRVPGAPVATQSRTPACRAVAKPAPRSCRAGVDAARAPRGLRTVGGRRRAACDRESAWTSRSDARIATSSGAWVRNRPGSPRYRIAAALALERRAFSRALPATVTPVATSRIAAVRIAGQAVAAFTARPLPSVRHSGTGRFGTPPVGTVPLGVGVCECRGGAVASGGTPRGYVGHLPRRPPWSDPMGLLVLRVLPRVRVHHERHARHPGGRPSWTWWRAKITPGALRPALGANAS